MRISRWLPVFIGVSVFWVASLTASTLSYRVDEPAGPQTESAQKPSPEDVERGKALAERVCTACHELGPDMTAGRSPDAWKKTVEEMRVMGAQASDEEAALIVAYLVSTYPSKR